MRVNGERARTATRVKVDDQIKLRRRQLEYEFTVTAIPLRRGPAGEARACYTESSESIARREARVAELRRDRMQMPTTRGRPDKHTRRQLRDRNRRSE